MKRLADLLLTRKYLHELLVRTSGIILVAVFCTAGAAHAGPSVAAWIAPSTLAPIPSSPTSPLPATPDFGLAPGQALYAAIVTTAGTIQCKLATEIAPVSVATFVGLARGERPWIDPRSGRTTQRPLYEGTIIHRVVPEFLIQGGDPTGTGTGGPGFVIPDEIGVESVFERRGVLGLANRGPNTNGSQFFVTDGPAHHLDGRYTRIGLCSSESVVRRIAASPRGQKNRPVDPVVVQRVEIEAR